MHVKSHQALAEFIYDAMPQDAKDFMRLSDLELHLFARQPDEVENDNIAVFGGCSDQEAYAHSYKLSWDRETDTFEHLTGSAPTVIAQTPREARNAVREGDFDRARETLATTMSHYAIDATTIWHLSRELTSDQHRIGEEDIAKKVRKLVRTPVEPLELPTPKSLYRSTIAICEDTVRTQVDRVKADQSKDNHLHDDELIAEMVNRCASFGLSAFLYAWKYVGKA